MNRILTTRRLLSVFTVLLVNSSLFLCGEARGLKNGGKVLASDTNQASLNLLTTTQTLTADVYTYGWADQTYVPSGGQINLSIFVGNAGPDDASNVTLTSQLPSGVTFSGAVIDNGSCTGAPDGTSFNCTLPTVNANETGMISVSVTATGEPYALLNATFTVASDALDDSSDNNAGVAQFYIASPPLPTPTPGATDEAQLVYLKFDQSTSQDDIFGQRADSAGLTNLTNSSVDESSFIWSPDGSRLGFLSYDSVSSGVSFCVMNADGSNLTVLTNVSGEYINSFAWSPDSSKLIFSASTYANDTSTGEVYVINADGTGRVNVSGTDGYNSEPAWSPDGTQISFSRAYYSPDSPPTNDIYVANADGTNQTQIAHADGERDFTAMWSPDGAWLAFMRYLADNTISVYMVRPDGSDIHRLISDLDVQTSSPQWSPDGSHLSYSSYSSVGSAIETINVDGSGRTIIYSPPQGGLYYGINGWQWSPDGTKLAFGYTIGEGQGGNICVVNADSTGLQCLGNDLEYNGNAEWSPDSTRLAFMSRRNGVPSIDIINADGTGRVELTGTDAHAQKWRPAPQ